jgi:hypothetical protein
MPHSMIGRVFFSGAHSLQTQMPQRRQWCRRRVREKGEKQSIHSLVVSSGTLQ